MRRILFVNKDRSFLEYYRTLMSSQTLSECYFAENEIRAFTYLISQGIDIVVTDLHAPLVNDIFFLDYLKEEYPNILRVVTAQESEMHHHMKEVHTAHRFFYRTSSESGYFFEDSLERAYSVEQIKLNDNIVEVLGEMDSMPSLPKVYTNLTMAGIPSSMR